MLKYNMVYGPRFTFLLLDYICHGTLILRNKKTQMAAKLDVATPYFVKEIYAMVKNRVVISEHYSRHTCI